MKTVEDIISEVRARTDASAFTNEEILDFINELDDMLRETVFQEFDSERVDFTDGTYSYDVSSFTNPERIESITADGKLLIKKKSPNDFLQGWYFSGVNVLLSHDIVDENTGMEVNYRPECVPHLLGDTDLAVPEPYHDLYVFYALSQIASREADSVSYNNYQNDYNSLLSEVISVLKRKQAYPAFTK